MDLKIVIINGPVVLFSYRTWIHVPRLFVKINNIVGKHDVCNWLFLVIWIVWGRSQDAVAYCRFRVSRFQVLLCKSCVCICLRCSRFVNDSSECVSVVLAQIKKMEAEQLWNTSVFGIVLHHACPVFKVFAIILCCARPKHLYPLTFCAWWLLDDWRSMDVHLYSVGPQLPCFCPHSIGFCYS